MKTITVNTSKRYDVIIGEDILTSLGTYSRAVCKGTKAAVISDSHVWSLYGQSALCGLQAAGFQAVHYVFPAGEASKNGQTYLSILSFLANNGLTRADVIIALGGGVVGDMTGFAAATYLRGIPYIQIPTTLLAMVDSSVGGKTAIDLPAGKNLAGAFYQPSLVLCDIRLLDSLPADIFRDGCAEVIKYGVLYDRALFSHLAEHLIDFDREAVISRCVELKRDVVTEDEFDTGARQKLNLGHTIGHSVEKLSNFTLSHGQAVAIGMAAVTRAALADGTCIKEDASAVISVISAFGLPTIMPYSPEAVYQNALSDKKRSADTVNLILPRRIGDCMISPTPVSQLEAFIRKGL